MTDEVLEDPGGLVKFVVPYSNNDGEFLGVVTQEDVEYDAKNRVYHCKYCLYYLITMETTRPATVEFFLESLWIA